MALRGQRARFDATQAQGMRAGLDLMITRLTSPRVQGVTVGIMIGSSYFAMQDQQAAAAAAGESA